jgi:site-specific recombinase XerD
MDTTPTIQSAINGFLSGHTKGTASSYSTPLRHFAAFLAERGLVVEQESSSTLTVDQAIHFVDWLRDKEDYERSTVQTYLTAVYRFYRYLLRRGADLSAAGLARLEETYRDARNIRGESRPKDPKLSAVRAVIAQARAVVPKPGSDDRRRALVRLRDIAIVETLRATGCRVGELVGMRLGDLDLSAKSALVKGKGSKYRHVYWDQRAWGSLDAYRQARQASAEGNPPLFVGHGNRSNGGPLTTRHVERTIKRLAKRAGIKEVVTPHYFRHVFATQVLGATDNLAVVQDLMGHASPDTTRVYAKTNEDQLRGAHGRAWEA